VVLDASVVLAWFIDVPIPPLAERARRALHRDAHGLVPSLWFLEMANGLGVAERRGFQSPSEIEACLRDVELLLASVIEVDLVSSSIRCILAVSQKFGVTSYDATYLDLAMRQRVPLATLDKELASAATRAGIELFR
jgi:predicted nucleic acid-binding protein